MNSLHLHLILNHVPAIGFFFGGFVLLVAILKNNRLVGSLALILFLICGAVAFIVFQTGEGAEEVVEHMESVEHQSIKWHEHTADPALWAAIVAAVWAGVVLLLERRKKGIHKAARYISLILAVVVFGLMFRTGVSGGLIRHPEIHQMRK